jgi:hypothetical protein
MSFENLLDPTGKRKGEFDAILDFLTQSPQRPKRDYAKLSNADFLATDFLSGIREIQCSFMLLFRSFVSVYQRFKGVPEPIARNGYLSLAKIMEWNRSAGPQRLYETYCAYPDPTLVGLYIDLKLEGSFLNSEFVARLEHKPFSSEMILVDWDGLDREKELLRIAKSKGTWGRKWSDDNIKSTLGKMYEWWREVDTVTADETTMIPEFPDAPHIQMLPDEKEFWEGPMTKAWHDGKNAFLRQAVPILSGEKELIPERARREQRTEWETIARQQRINDERSPDIEAELHNKFLDGLEYVLSIEKQEIDNGLSAQAYNLARKRAGEKGVIFLKALEEDRKITVKEASERAGLAYRSAKRILHVLRNSLPNPS